MRHVFDPLPDSRFNTDQAVQLERTLKTYPPLLSNEELKIGKYCGAFGMCNSALFILYEYLLSHDVENAFDKHQILRSIEETALNALKFAEASAQPWPTVEPLSEICFRSSTFPMDSLGGSLQHGPAQQSARLLVIFLPKLRDGGGRCGR